MNNAKISLLQLLGQDESALVDYQGMRLHESIIADLQRLRADALDNGFDLAIASGYRSFARQCTLWNEKANGKRKVVSDTGTEIDMGALSEEERMFAILRYSALPGASRHHWGTDIDIFDRAAMPEGYTLQLSAEETEADGPFAAMHRWLDERIEKKQSYGFYRPYVTGNKKRHAQGFAEERWHLSHAPTSHAYEIQLNPKELACFYKKCSDLALINCVQEHFQTIYDNYIAP